MLGKTADLNHSNKARPNSASGPCKEVFVRSQRGSKDDGAMLPSAQRKHNRCGRHLMPAAKSVCIVAGEGISPAAFERNVKRREKKFAKGHFTV